MFELIHEILFMSVESAEDILRNKGYMSLSHVFKKVNRLRSIQQHAINTSFVF